MNAPTTTREITFYEILPATEAVYGPGLPTCPDGSGDLWWDQASYTRYQSYDPIEQDAQPERLAYWAFTPGYCDGSDYRDLHAGIPTCHCHEKSFPF